MAIVLHRFSWSTATGDRRTAVWVAYDNEVQAHSADRQIGGMLAEQYGLSRRQDRLTMAVDVEPALAAQWRAAAEAYFAALREADGEWHRDRGRSSLFRSRTTIEERAKERWAAAVAVADAAYEPHRSAAAEALDAEYAPLLAFARAKQAAYAMAAWTFEVRGRVAHVLPRSGGYNHDQLLNAILKRGITAFEWGPVAVARAEEVLGPGRFDEWWREWGGHWNYRMTPPSDRRRGGPSSNYWSPGSF